MKKEYNYWGKKTFKRGATEKQRSDAIDKIFNKQNHQCELQGTCMLVEENKQGVCKFVIENPEMMICTNELSSVNVISRET